MLSTRQVVMRGLKVFAASIALDGAIALGVFALYGWDLAHGVFGDIAFLETAILLVAGGFYDWSQAEWGVGLKRLTGNAEARYDGTAHREADKKGAALVLAAALVFLLDLLVELVVTG